jgi:hypothetical protein
MRQYRAEDITLGRNRDGSTFVYTDGGKTLGASETNTVISKEFSVSRSGSLDIRVKASASGVTSSSGITIQLQHWDGTPATSSFAFTDTDVSTSGNTITKTAHGQQTGDTVVFTVAGSDVLPAPLVAGVTYYVINASSSTIKAATTAANAAAGTAIDITTAGTSAGAFTASFSGDRWVTQSKAGTAVTANGADYYILLRVEVSGDQADLPLMPRARVVATTGSGDAVTFTNVTVMQGL